MNQAFLQERWLFRCFALQEKQDGRHCRCHIHPRGWLVGISEIKIHGLFICILDNFFMAAKAKAPLICWYSWFMSGPLANYSLCDAWILHVSQCFWIKQNISFWNGVNNSSHLAPWIYLSQQKIARQIPGVFLTSLPRGGCTLAAVASSWIALWPPPTSCSWLWQG